MDNTCTCNCKSLLIRGFIISAFVCTITISCCITCCVVVLQPDWIVNKSNAPCTNTDGKNGPKEVTIVGDEKLQYEATRTQWERSYSKVEMEKGNDNDISRMKREAESPETSEAKMRHKKKGRKGSGKGGAKGKGGKGKKIKAAHFVPLPDDTLMKKAFNSYSEHTLIETSTRIPEMEGTLFKNGDFSPDNNGTLHVFKPADWVNDKSNPVTLSENGIFRPKKPGVYLIYAQVLFHDSKTQQAIGIVQRRRTVDGQFETVQKHYCISNRPNNGAAYHQTCSVTALFNLKKGDELIVVNWYGIVMSFAKTSTFFGAIQLS